LTSESGEFLLVLCDELKPRDLAGNFGKYQVVLTNFSKTMENAHDLGKMSGIRKVKTRDIARLWVKNPVSKTMDSEDLCPT
jgi:hypothetical protein